MRLPWPALLALFTCAFIAVMTELLPAGLLPEMASGLGVAQSRVGFLVTAYAVASFAAAIPVTALVRRLPRRALLMTLLAGFALVNLVTAASSSYALTFAARGLAGVVGGTMWAMLVGYAARLVPAGRSGRAIAIVSAGITVALCFGIPAGAALAGVTGWRTAFATLSAVALGLAVLLRWAVPDLPGERGGGRRVTVPPGVWPLLATTGLLLVGHQSMYTYLAPFAGSATPVLLLVFGLATVGGVVVTAVLVDRWLRVLAVAALAMVAVSLAALGLGFLPAVAVWGLAFGGAPTLLQAWLVRNAGPGNADMAVSMQTTVYNAGIAAGSLAGGLVLDGMGAPALPWVAAPLVLAALLLLMTTRMFMNDRSVV